MRTLWYAGLLLLAGIVLFACQSGDLNVGQSVINPQELVVQSVDSITIQTSTVLKPDSFVTSGDVNILVGRWTDKQTGTMTARSFANVNYASNSLAGATNLRLDSLVLELNYAFAYGDTTSSFDLSIHSLSTSLLTQLYYNTYSAAYASQPLLRRVVVPQPLSRTRQIQFRISDDLAQGFYTKLINSEIIDATTLSEFLPGFAFNCNSNGNTFVGFTAATSGLRLYYHTTDIDRTSINVLFPFSGIYFTQIKNDLSGTPLSALKNRSDAVSSRLTDNTTFVIPGAQLQTRIELPYLGQFDRPERFADLNNASLVVSPVRRDFNDNTQPPTNLALFFTNNQNEILPSSVPGGTAGATGAIATYSYDASALTLTDTYTFDLTYYIGQIIKRKALNQPLLLSIPTETQLQRSFTLRERIQRVTLGNQQRPNDQLKVKLFITSGT